MAPKEHHYQVTVKWTGNKGNGTQTYKSYDRSYEMSSTNKPTILGSSDPAFLGDNSRWNPEDLLLASASACHKLWYLHLCAVDGISVLSYIDEAEGTMREGEKGKFTNITLKPKITIRDSDDVNRAMELHHKAHELCFIANSLNFPIECIPTIAQNELAK